MDQRIRAKLAQAARDPVRVAYVDLPESGEPNALSRALQVALLPLARVEVVEGVENADLIGALEQGFHDVRADGARPARDEYLHE